MARLLCYSKLLLNKKFILLRISFSYVSYLVFFLAVIVLYKMGSASRGNYKSYGNSSNRQELEKNGNGQLGSFTISLVSTEFFYVPPFFFFCSVLYSFML